MIERLKKFTKAFRRREEGGVFLIEFVFMFPIILILFLFSVELGIYSMRHMFLDRGLDVTVRHIRLNTQKNLRHDDLKDMICENAGFLPDCKQTMRLEMVTMDPRNFAQFNPDPDCIDTGQPVNPARGIVLGQPHEIMMLRACYRFTPVFGSVGLGLAFDKDSGGQARMVSSSLFVQEPN